MVSGISRERRTEHVKAYLRDCSNSYCCCNSRILWMTTLLTKAITKHPDNIVCAAVAMVIYLCNRLFLKDITHGYIQYICKCHLNDFLCPLAIMPCIEVLLMISVGYEWRNAWGIILSAFLCGLVWEYIIPIFKRSSVSDPIDLLCYVCGAFLYSLIVLVYRRKIHKL